MNKKSVSRSIARIITEPLMNIIEERKEKKILIFYLRIYTDAVAAFSYFHSGNYDKMMIFLKKLKQGTYEPPAKSELKHIKKIESHISAIMNSIDNNTPKNESLIKNNLKTIQGICFLRIISL